MSAIRTFTVTVANPGAGNRYYIDGVLQDTINLAEGYTYVFNYPSAHPFRFSTTSDGTHNSGSEYTTGVTVNSSTQVQITVAASAPTLYYYCSIHSGMGGTANTPSEDTWGALGWDTNSWGISSLTVGWGADAWNDSVSTWGDVGDEIVSLTAPDAIVSNLSVGSEWGDDTWGEEQGWGQFVLNPADVMGVSGVSSTSAVGSVSFTIDATASVSGVASTPAVGSLTPADVMGLSGVSSTSDVGTVSIASNPVVAVSGVQITSAVGAIDPSAQVVGLDGVSFTASVGSLVPADVMGLTGQEFTASVTSTIGIQAYQDIDTGSNSSYTNVATGSNTSYSDAA